MFLSLVVAADLFSEACATVAEDDITQADTISHVIDGVRFEAGNWPPDLAAGQAGRSLGNHRAVIRVDEHAAAVAVQIPWRRNDVNPQQKDVIVVDAANGKPVLDRVIKHVSNEAGNLVFRPNVGSHTYYVYYMPYETSGGQYPKLSYLPQQATADQDWLQSIARFDDQTISRMPKARTVSIQSVDAFHSFFPMEVIATAAETSRLLRGKSRPFYLFPEDRRRPIRMRRYLPKHWVDRGLKDSFTGMACRGEYYTFQIGVYAADYRLEDVGVAFSDFASKDGSALDPSAFTCFNTGGVDHYGRPFSKPVRIEAGEVQALWIGVQIPSQTRPATYSGSVTVSAKGHPAQTVNVDIQVADASVEDHGDSRPENMTRLRWLNSTLGSDPNFIIAPYRPVRVAGRKLSILGRDILLDANGLPAQIRSWFTPEMTELASAPEDILAAPIELQPTTRAGVETWKSEPFQVRLEARGRATWSVHSRSERFELHAAGALEYDGMLDYRLELIAREDVDLIDIALPIALVPDAARYMLGLGRRGGYRPDRVNWTWKIEHHQEGLWLGNVHKGLQFVLRDRNYERPLNTNFYLTKPLNMPPSWYNDGKGGIRVETTADAVLACNYSGARHMQKGDRLHFNVRFLITPFKPLDTKLHFNTRFVHKYVPVEMVHDWGATVVNIHHANEINPYINYPFYNLDQQEAYIEQAHARGLKVKLYYTIRELTYKAHELFALRSLGDEILNDGDGGGHSWLQEHLRDRYHSAWHAWRVDDAAVLNKGTSRWTNYYVEGLNWLAEHQQIDGLYLDDIAFSRETVKRMVTVLQRHRREVVIDLHSANQYNPRDGFINSALLYMEHFPFISRLWFGEYFDYDREADYWITEVSGLPFGLMGEMLQDGGHPYRGLLYGMTSRIYGDVDPRPIWRMMNDFGIDSSRMLGYWLDDAPVRTDNKKVLATSYVRRGTTLIVLASWETADVDVRLAIDWPTLGVSNPSAVSLVAPEVEGLQERATFDVNQPIRVPAAQGLFLLLSHKP
jgi:hypothetical protein